MSMQRFIHIIRGLLSIVLTACSFGDEPAICPYNTRLEYWYAGSGNGHGGMGVRQVYPPALGGSVLYFDGCGAVVKPVGVAAVTRRDTLLLGA